MLAKRFGREQASRDESCNSEGFWNSRNKCPALQKQLRFTGRATELLEEYRTLSWHCSELTQEPQRPEQIPPFPPVRKVPGQSSLHSTVIRPRTDHYDRW